MPLKTGFHSVIDIDTVNDIIETFLRFMAIPIVILTTLKKLMSIELSI